MSDEVFHGRNRALEARADAQLAPIPPTSDEIEFAIGAALEAQHGWRTATQQCFVRFAAAGRLLTRQKDALEHGAWQAWLVEHMPDRYVTGKRGPEFKASCEAWQRTARNWMRIADILDHCHPSIIESAQTVTQLFRLAQFLPEGLPAPGGDAPAPPAPDEVVTRIRRWITTNADVLSIERIRSFPPEVKGTLRELIAPIWDELSAA